MSKIEMMQREFTEKCERIKDLESAMQETLDWYLEYGVILKPQIDKLKQLLEK